MLKPREAVPALEVSTVDGAPWRLADQTPETFSLVVFYRGLHCPVCSRYVKGLADSQGEFRERGVQAIAISTDDGERAARARQDWQLGDLRIGHGLTIEQARAWGLYVSNSRGVTSAGIEEPKQFNEPGLFLVRPDGTLYWAAVQSVPFARPHLDEVLKRSTSSAPRTTRPAATPDTEQVRSGVDPRRGRARGGRCGSGWR